MRKSQLPKINMAELCSALEDSSYENRYYLDCETGEILFLMDYADDEESEKLKDKIDNEPDRYESVPKLESHEMYMGYGGFHYHRGR